MNIYRYLLVSVHLNKIGMDLKKEWIISYMYYFITEIIVRSISYFAEFIEKRKSNFTNIL